MDSKALEDAIRHISLELKDNPNANRSKLIEEASQKYDLSPLQADFLLNKYVLGK